MNNRTKIIVGAVLIALVFGYGGYWYGRQRGTLSRNPSGFTQRGGFGQSVNNNMPRRMGGNGMVSGDILSKENNGMTIKLRNGSTQIVLVAPSTEVTKMAPTTQSELLVGKSVFITGKTNSDGSVSASSIQIRPDQALPVGR